MTVKSKKTILLRIFLYLFIIACAVLCVFPFYWQIRSALMSNSEIFRFPPRMWPESPQWSNFITALTAFNFLGYLKNTMSIMLPVLLGTVITCPLCAYAFARLHFPGQKIWFRIAHGDDYVAVYSYRPANLCYVEQAGNDRYLCPIDSAGLVWRWHF